MHPRGGATREFHHVLRQAWKAFYSQRRLWSVPGCPHAKMRVLHLAIFPSMAWTSGTIRIAQTRDKTGSAMVPVGHGDVA